MPERPEVLPGLKMLRLRKDQDGREYVDTSVGYHKHQTVIDCGKNTLSMELVIDVERRNVSKKLKKSVKQEPANKVEKPLIILGDEIIQIVDEAT